MQNNQPLIIGYGRAGKRHDKLLQARGYLPAIVEPDIEQLGQEQRRHFFNLAGALSADQWAFAVICTPPDQHLQQIETCLDNNLVVLCEKPLCGFGQLDYARKLVGQLDINKKVMVAYNYRFSLDWPSNLIESVVPYSRALDHLRGITIFSSVFRNEQPTWGYILDHVAHALDNLIWKFGRLTVETARVNETPTKYLTLVYGSFVQGGWFKIHEEVRKFPCDRVVWIGDDRIQVPITANPLMFENMWDYFFATLKTGGVFHPGLQEALETQEALEDVYYYADNTVRPTNC